MRPRIRQIVLDAKEIEPVARFWTELLQLEVTYSMADWVSLSGPVSLAVQRNPDHRTAGLGDPDRPQQVHLDIEVEDIESAESLVLRNGGTELKESPDAEPPFRVYADPAGHPFCLEYVE